jgi:small conductance mechanosensitive channel
VYAEVVDQLELIVPRILRVALIIIVALFLLRSTFISRRVLRHVRKKSETGDVEAAQRLETISTAILRLIQFLIGIVAFSLILNELGFDTTAIIASAGIAGLAISLGAQALIRDFLNGAMILFEDQYRVGDVITVSGVTGTVESIDLRVTTVRDIDGTLHFVPNGEIRLTSNLTRNYGVVVLDLGFSFEVNLSQARRIIDEVGAALSSDPDWSERLPEAPQFVRIQDFTQAGVLLRVMGRTTPGDQWAVTGELRMRLLDAFGAAGIDMTIPQSTIWRSPAATGKEPTND